MKLLNHLALWRAFCSCRWPAACRARQQGRFNMTAEHASPCVRHVLLIGRPATSTRACIAPSVSSRAEPAPLATAMSSSKRGAAQTVVVEAPGASDGQQLVPLLTSSGQIFFIDTGDKSLSVGHDVTGSLCEAAVRQGDSRSSFAAKISTQIGQRRTRSEHTAAHRRLSVQGRRQDPLRRLHRLPCRPVSDDHAGWQGDRVGGDSEPNHRTRADQRQLHHDRGHHAGCATHPASCRS